MEILPTKIRFDFLRGKPTKLDSCQLARCFLISMWDLSSLCLCSFSLLLWDLKHAYNRNNTRNLDCLSLIRPQHIEIKDRGEEGTAPSEFFFLSSSAFESVWLCSVTLSPARPNEVHRLLVLPAGPQLFAHLSSAPCGRVRFEPAAAQSPV